MYNRFNSFIYHWCQVITLVMCALFLTENILLTDMQAQLIFSKHMPAPNLPATICSIDKDTSPHICYVGNMNNL